MPRTTIVVPCYNEAERLDVRAFRDFIGRTIGLRFLFVNDGSTDQTLRVLEGLAAEAPRHFAVLDLPQNAGKAEAVRQGILRALSNKPAFVGFLDADLATPLDALPGLCRALENNPEMQIVLGSRVRLLGRRIERRPMRHYLGRVFATAASWVLGLPVYDTQCGAKLFRACEEVGLLFEEPFRTKWIFDVELLARFVQARYVAGERPAEEAIVEIPLMEWHDVAGSKIRARDYLKAAFELVRIHRTYRCRASRVPTTPEPVEAEDPGLSTRREAM